MTNFEKKLVVLRRPLKVEEIDWRVQSIKAKGGIILGYKDARCDMNILDESGVIWQRDHKMIEGSLYCGVGIFNEDIEQWTWKWDVGTESNTEATKGQASDSFKRACFNWGIGRELYDLPFVWVNKRYADDKFADIKSWVWGLDRGKDEKIINLAAKDKDSNVMFHWKAKSADKVITKKQTQDAQKDIDETHSIRTVIENLDLCKSQKQILDMVEREGLDPLDPRISMHIDARMKLVKS